MSNKSNNSNTTWGEYELSLTEGKTHWTENSSTDQLDVIKGLAYEQGMKDALSYLAELYESIDETDLWKTYMTEEENN